MEIIEFNPQSLLLIFLPIIFVFSFVLLLRYFGTERKSVNLRGSYNLRQNILTKAESDFYNVLKIVIGENYVVFPKIRLADIFFTKNGKGYYAALNKITAKHIDFLLCDPVTFSPILAIELDDKSHQKQSRRARDQFVDHLFGSQELPLLRIKAARSYQVDEIRNKLLESLRSKGEL